MFQFVITNIFLLSIGAMLYLVTRSLPRVDTDEPREAKVRFIDRLATSEVPEKIDEAFNSFLAKFLRKLKVVLMKVDNALTQRLKKIKTENGNGKTPVGFDAIIVQKNEVIIEKEVSEEKK